MPDLPECIHSPVKDNPFVVGAAMSSGVRKYCDWLNPDHPDYNPRVVQDYLEMSLNLMADKKPVRDDVYEQRTNAWVQGELARLLREGKIQRPIIHYKPKAPVELPEESRSSSGKPMALISDDSKHSLTYESARDCPHLIKEEGCCGGVRLKCGPDGRLPGLGVSIADCYPCMAKQLGIAIE